MSERKLRIKLKRLGKRLVVLWIFCLMPVAICRGGSINLDSSIYFFQEQEKSLSIKDVASGQMNPSFQKVKTSRLYFGITQRPYWIKIKPDKNLLTSSQNWILELDTFKLNSVDVFYRNSKNEWLQLSDGVQIQRQTPRRPKRNNVFHLKDVAAESPLFLKLEAFFISMPVHLWSFSDYVEKEQIQILSDGLFYGVVLAIIIYHFFIYLAVKNRSYFSYAFFLIAVILIYLSGQGWIHAYLISYFSVPLSNLTHLTGPFSGWLLLLTGIRFTRDYLNLSQWAIRLNKTLFGFQILSIIIGIVAIGFVFLNLNLYFGILYNFGFVLAVIIIMISFFAAIQGIRYQQPTARYYLMATSMQFVVSIFMILSAYYLIPLEFDWKILQISSMVEMLIFSFGLSRQVKQIELEKQRYNHELLTTRGKMIEQLEVINELKDKVLSKVIESRLYPELATLFSVMNNVLYLQAIGNYSKIVYLNDGIEDEIEIQASLKDIETCFDNTIFVRIHKTYLIKLGAKLSLQRRSSADYDLISQHYVLPVGRKYSAEVKLLVANSSS